MNHSEPNYSNLRGYWLKYASNLWTFFKKKWRLQLKHTLASHKSSHLDLIKESIHQLFVVHVTTTYGTYIGGNLGGGGSGRPQDFAIRSEPPWATSRGSGAWASSREPVPGNNDKLLARRLTYLCCLLVGRRAGVWGGIEPWRLGRGRKWQHGWSRGGSSTLLSPGGDHAPPCPFLDPSLEKFKTILKLNFTAITTPEA